MINENASIIHEYQSFLKGSRFKTASLYLEKAKKHKAENDQHSRKFTKFTEARQVVEVKTGKEISHYFSKYLESLLNQNLCTESLRLARYRLRFFDNAMAKLEVKYLEQVTPQILERYRSLLNRHIKKNQKLLSMVSKKRLLSEIKRYFAFLYLQQCIEKNPARKLKLPRLSKRISMNFWDMKKVRVFLDSLPKKTLTQKRMVYLYLLSYFYGLRISEACRIKVSDIDFEHKTLFIGHTKNSEARTLPLIPEALSLLKEYIKEVRSKMVKDETPYLFVSQINKKSLSKQQVQELFHTSVKKLEFKKKYSFHVFRYSFATELLRRGMPIRYIQSLLGHKSLSSTGEYTKVITDDLKHQLRRHHPRDVVGE